MTTPTNEALQGARTLLSAARDVGDTRSGGYGISYALERLEPGLSARVSDRARVYSSQTGSLASGMEWAVAEVLDEQALRRFEGRSGLGTNGDTPPAAQAQQQSPPLWQGIMTSLTDLAATTIREVGGAYRANEIMRVERERTRAETEAIRQGLWPSGTSPSGGGTAPAGGGVAPSGGAPQSNTLLYVGGGLVVLTLGGILIYAFTKK